MRITLLLLLLATTGFVAVVRAQGAGAGRDVHPLDKLTGSELTVEGLAWGYMNKGLSNWLTTGEGMRIYASGVDYKNLNGRLVRFTGILHKRRMEAAPQGAQGYGRAFDYYEIEVAKAAVINRVQKGLPQTQDSHGKSAYP